MTGYYDAVLGLIPLTLVGITAVLTTAGFTVTSAVPLAASIPVALIGHALFVNSPVDETPTAVEDTAASADSPGFEAAD